MRNVASLQSELKWMIFVLVQSCTNVFHVENPDIFFAHAILVSSASCLDVLILFWVHLFFLVSSFEFNMSGQSSNWGGPYSAPADEQAARTWSVRSFQKQELPEQSTAVQAACTWSVRSFQKKELQEQSTAAPGSSAAPWLTDQDGLTGLITDTGLIRLDNHCATAPASYMRLVAQPTAPASYMRLVGAKLAPMTQMLLLS